MLVSHVPVVITFSLKFNAIAVAFVTLERLLPGMLSLVNRKLIGTFKHSGALFAGVYSL